MSRISRTVSPDLGLDVKTYGATGDGVTDDTAAITRALAACTEGQELFFPLGTYLISSPLVLQRNRSLRGTHAPRWAYDTGAPSRIKAAPSFTGDALIRLKDEEEQFGSVGGAANGQNSGPNDQCGMRISRLTLDGANVAGPIAGIKATGLVRDVRLVEVCVRRTSGHGITTAAYVRLDTKSYYPRGWALQQVVCDTTGNMGFAFNLLNDSTLVDCLAVSATNHGFYLAGPGEVLAVGCRSVFNKGHGWYLTGSTYGNVVLSACSTDRNTQHGILVDATGKQPILLNGVVLRRDGGNNNGGGAGYCGLFVNGATAPVIVGSMTTETGVDDAGAGAWTPQYGVKATNAFALVVAAGVLWGRDSAYVDGGGNTTLKIASGVLQATGTTASPTYTVTA